MFVTNETSYKYQLNDISPVIMELKKNLPYIAINKQEIYLGHLAYINEAFSNSSIRPTIINDKFFYHPVTIANICIHIHFNITESIKLSSGSQTTAISLSQFTNTISTDSDTAYYYVKQTLNGNFFSPNYSPIIIIRYPVTQTIPYLVIDGNHRTTAAINNNRRYIDSVILDPLHNHGMFFTEFDYAFYQTMRFLQDCLHEYNSANL